MFLENNNLAGDITSGLNPEQMSAVLHDKGPLLILAGAGSGKTRVITHRIAHLVRDLGVSPYRILALTFTNKAAAEMKNRIEGLIGADVGSLWVGTFHSLMVRILRRHIELLGFDRTFIILDTDDQLKVIRSCLDELNLDEKRYPAKALSSAISSAKNELTSAEEFELKSSSSGNFMRTETAKVYKLYQAKLKASSALDFDDILFFAVEIFRKYPDVLEHYRNKFEYILVDEYQDTNHAQYVIVELLAKKHGNLCVVGDDDQSIYAFRGANISNILDFEHDFKGCKVIKLERNYRSTGNILGAANSVIANNKGRKAKELWTSSDEGDLITYLRADNHVAEARFVASEIRRLVDFAGSCKYGDIAVLYRINALSRNFENELMAARIPFKLFGGMRFYERKEIRDIIAYMRLILVGDDMSFDRVVNVPRRGIGDVTKSAVFQAAASSGVSCLEAASDSMNIPELSRSAPKLINFYDLIQSFRYKLDENKMSLAAFFEYVQDESGMIQEIIEQRERDKHEDVKDRVETLKEHLSAVVEFEGQLSADMTGSITESAVIADADADANADATDDEFRDEDDHPITSLRDKLAKYIESISLYIDKDTVADEDDAVKLMTIHSAKGLEFDNVFMVGAEEGIFPGLRSINDLSGEAIEEERRLAYVSITRARKKLYITTAFERMLFGQTQIYPTSRFVLEIPSKYLNEISQRRSYQSQSQSQGPRLEHARQEGSSYFQSTLSKPFRDTVSRSASSPFGRPRNESSSRNAASSDQGDYLKSSDIRKGDIVAHSKFGKGIVRSLVPVANDAIIEIDFDDFGLKKMMVRQAKLSKA